MNRVKHVRRQIALGSLQQGEFKNRRKSRNRRANEAGVFFAPKSASLRRRLQFFELTLAAARRGDF